MYVNLARDGENKRNAFWTGLKEFWRLVGKYCFFKYDVNGKLFGVLTLGLSARQLRRTWKYVKWCPAYADFFIIPQGGRGLHGGSEYSQQKSAVGGGECVILDQSAP